MFNPNLSGVLLAACLLVLVPAQSTDPDEEKVQSVSQHVADKFTDFYSLQNFPPRLYKTVKILATSFADVKGYRVYKLDLVLQADGEYDTPKILHPPLVLTCVGVSVREKIGTENYELLTTGKCLEDF